MRVLRIKSKVAYVVSAFIFTAVLIVSWTRQQTNQDSGVVYWLFGPGVIRQTDVDYFARVLKVNYTVVENSFKNGQLYRAEINITNTGKRTFPWKDWSIVFCQPYMAEPSEDPYPQGLAKPESRVRLFSMGGGVYRFEPMAVEKVGEVGKKEEDTYEGIRPGRTHSILLTSKYSNIAITDNYPNWYVAMTGLEPRVIENTRGESYTWVGPYNTSNLWKRFDDQTSSDFDHFNPFTLRQRFDRGVKDLREAPIPIIPTPAEVEVYDKTKNLNVLNGNVKWTIVHPPEFSAEAKYLKNIWDMIILSSPPNEKYIKFVKEEVRVSIQGRLLPTDESYELRVSPQSNVILIKASKPAGAFYAMQSLISLTDPSGNISATVIRDAPRYEYRGFMIDVARNFQSRDNIFRYIEVMAMYKLNKLHLHLTDDEGWRLAIPGLPELTEIGATRCHDLTETKCLLPFLGTGPFAQPPGTGFYTLEDYRTILRFAAVHHIEVIPEVDMPGHSHAAIKAMEARRRHYLNINATEAARFLLQDLNDQSQYVSVQGFENNAINPCLQSTYTFISRIINSLFALHKDVNPLKTFHFGGDEVAKNAWSKSPVCERLKQNGVNIPISDYLAIQISNMTSLYNLDLAGWEDGLMDENQPFRRGALKNKNVYSYVWNNVWEWGNARRAYDFANNGYKVVITPATNFYFDHPQEPDPKERGLYWASRYTDTLQVFNFMPENYYANAKTKRFGSKNSICEKPADCPKLEKRENIAGIQATLFGELLRTDWITDYMILPRLLALAERAWHHADWESEQDEAKRDRGMLTDWTNFANTLGHKELARLDKMGYTYRIPPPGAKLEDHTLQVALTFPGLIVEYSVDEGVNWRALSSTYTAFVPKNKKCLVRTRAASGERFSRTIEFPRRDKPSSGWRLMPSLLSQVMAVLLVSVILH